MPRPDRGGVGRSWFLLELVESDITARLDASTTQRFGVEAEQGPRMIVSGNGRGRFDVEAERP